jgi:outer membrane protein assembly factor BamE (lipoprotein component of BamABCDE complex)
MMNRTLIAVAALLTGLAGCAPQGVTNPDSRIANLRDGKTTYDQVTQEFGNPLTDKVARDGTRTVTYAIHQQQASGDVHSPILGPFSGKVTRVQNDLALEFDKQGVLMSHSSNIKPAPEDSNSRQ